MYERGRGRWIKAADLIERVHTDVDTGEKDYFSLYFYFNNQKVRGGREGVRNGRKKREREKEGGMKVREKEGGRWMKERKE